MHAVIATAGHVDHGKSALVRALTGTEPDRWDEERRRGLTIDLGFAWTTLDAGTTISFVDVPGHQRFIGNMLAGIGSTAAVMFVVAADEGWRTQSEEHLLAIDALGIDHGLLVVTRSDLADPTPAKAESLERIAKSSLGNVAAVAVSARTGAGIPELRHTLGVVAGQLPAPSTARTRLWIDRSFTIRGAGTVVTGTLGEGRLESGERLTIVTDHGGRAVRVRGLHSLDSPVTSIDARSRAAVNLADVEASGISRGDALVSDGWTFCREFDALLDGAHSRDLPEYAMLHVGTYSGQVRVRPLGDTGVRVTLRTALPLYAGDRALLRNPGIEHVVAGLRVVDVDPPPLRRRGAAHARGARIAELSTDSRQQFVDEIRRRGAVRRHEVAVDYAAIREIRVIGDWLVLDARWTEWRTALTDLITEQAARDPLDPSISQDAVARQLQLPTRDLLTELVADRGLTATAGRIHDPHVIPDLGAKNAALQEIEANLRARPWGAPEQHDLDRAGIGPRELAAAAALQRIIRLPGDIVLLPDGPARAMRELAALPQPFTTSDARRALNTTRRVAIPLLEHLDQRGWTRRVDTNHREVTR